MTLLHTRRSVLQNSVAVAAGAVGGMLVIDGMAAAAVQSGARIGQVVQASGRRADVTVDGTTRSVEIIGFPNGWQLRRGDQVMVTSPTAAENPNSACPLVLSVEGAISHRNDTEVMVSGTPVALRPQTIRAERSAPNGSRAGAFCLRNDVDQSLTAVAIIH